MQIYTDFYSITIKSWQDSCANGLSYYAVGKPAWIWTTILTMLQSASCSFPVYPKLLLPLLRKNGNADLGFSGLSFSCMHFWRAKIQKWLGHLLRAKLLLPLQSDISLWWGSLRGKWPCLKILEQISALPKPCTVTSLPTKSRWCRNANSLIWRSLVLWRTECRSHWTVVWPSGSLKASEQYVGKAAWAVYLHHEARVLIRNLSSASTVLWLAWACSRSSAQQLWLQGDLARRGTLAEFWFYQHKDSDRLIKLCKAVTEWFVFSCTSGGEKKGWAGRSITLQAQRFWGCCFLRLSGFSVSVWVRAWKCPAFPGSFGPSVYMSLSWPLQGSMSEISRCLVTWLGLLEVWKSSGNLKSF